MGCNDGSCCKNSSVAGAPGATHSAKSSVAPEAPLVARGAKRLVQPEESPEKACGLIARDDPTAIFRNTDINHESNQVIRFRRPKCLERDGQLTRQPICRRQAR